MRSLFRTLTVCCCLVLGLGLLAVSASADDPGRFVDKRGDFEASMIADGWTLSAPGVWTRDEGNGITRRRAIGAEGLQSFLADHEVRFEALVERYLESPNPKLAEVLRSYQARMQALEAKSLSYRMDPTLEARALRPRAALTCVQDWWATLPNTTCGLQTASAGAKSTGGGSCPTCTLGAFAYVDRPNCSNVVQSDWEWNEGSGNNTTITANASISISTPGPNCESYAEGWISCPGGPDEEIWVDSQACNCKAWPC